MNTGFYKDLDTNFEQACYLCENEFSHEELLELLKNGNIPQKQIAALKFDYVNSENDARALVSVLTGCDGKIREAAALKIFQIISSDLESRKLFCKMPPKIFADATIDINANICRLVVDSVKLLKPFDEFVSEYVEGTIITIKQYWSTSKTEGYNDLAKIKIYIQNTKNGRDISSIGLNENEVLYERNSKFKVISKILVGEIWHILLEEAD